MFKWLVTPKCTLQFVVLVATAMAGWNLHFGEGIYTVFVAIILEQGRHFQHGVHSPCVY